MNDPSLLPAASEVRSPSKVKFAFGGDVGKVLEAHFRRDVSMASLSAKFKMYYRLRPLLPIMVRQFLQRGRNQRFDIPTNWYLPHDFIGDFEAAINRHPEAVAIHPWPDGYQNAVVLTHDVETKAGVALVDRLATLEEEYGLRSAWNFIPYKYKIDDGLLADLKQRGHEIGVHGYNHDGRLFESRKLFERRLGPINEAIHRFDSVGFRAPMVHRNLDWLQSLEIDYDASCFDVDPFQAMPGGVGGVWPFIVGRFVELPYTLPQDHTLLITLNETTATVWSEKLKYLRRLAGMAMLVTHPDYLDTAERLSVYREFLDHVTSLSAVWNALPCEVARWWRVREQLAIEQDEPTWRVTGPSSARAKLMTFGELL